MSLTPNFNPKHSGIRVEIYDHLGALAYTYEGENVKAKKPIVAISGNENVRDLYGVNNGTWTGTPTYSDGADSIEKAMSFANGRHVALDNEATFDFGKNIPFSYAFKYKPNTGEGQNQSILGNATTITSSGWTCFYNNGGSQGTNDRLIWYMIDEGSATYSLSTTQGALKMDTWNTVSGSYGGGNDRANMAIWLNGTKYTSTSLTTMTGDFQNANPCYISNSNIDLANSDVQKVFIYDFELTDAQHTAIQNSESPYGFVPSTDPAVQDFRLTDISMHIAANDSYGTCELVIEDVTGALIDTTKLRRNCKILPEYRVEVYLGKDAAGLERWFQGIIRDSDVIRPQTNDERIKLSCVGTGVILKERRTLMTLNQDKEADGIGLDPTDNKVTLYNLLLKLINEQGHQIDENLPLIKTIYANLGSNGIHQETLDIKLANINEHFTSYASFISRMAGLANADWYVNPDGVLIVRDSNVHSSGCLFTTDLTSIDTLGWNPKRLSYIVNQPFGWKDTSFEGMWTFIHGTGHFKPILDSSQEGTPNATDDMINEWLAIPVSMNRDNIFKIALRLSRTGIPPAPAEVRIVGGDGSGKYSQGMVDLNDIGAGDSLNTLTVNGVEIMGSATTYSGSARATALTIAGKINDHVSVPDYHAFVDDGAKITIQAAYQSDIPNGYVVTGTDTGFTPVYTNMGTTQKGIDGRPNFNDIRRSIKFTKAELGNLGTSTPAPWFEIPITPKLDLQPSEQIWILMPNTGTQTPTNTINFDYKTGSGKYYQSTDGFNWFEVTGEVNYRVYSAKRLTTTVENTRLSTSLPEAREKIIPFRGDLE
ncbi:MAG: hypothetical protein ACE5Q4_04385, partial [Nitrosopumilus sp.]